MYLPVSMPAAAAGAVGIVARIGPADDDFIVNQEPPHAPAALQRMSQPNEARS